MSRIYLVIARHPLVPADIQFYFRTKERVLAKYHPDAVTSQVELEQILDNKEQKEQSAAKYSMTVSYSNEAPFTLDYGSISHLVVGYPYFIQYRRQGRWVAINCYFLGYAELQKDAMFAGQEDGKYVILKDTDGQIHAILHYTFRAANKNYFHCKIGRFFIADYTNTPGCGERNESGYESLLAVLNNGNKIEELAYINPAVALDMLNTATGLNFTLCGDYKPVMRGTKMVRPAVLTWEYKSEDDPVPYSLLLSYHYRKKKVVAEGWVQGWNLTVTQL